MCEAVMEQEQRWKLLLTDAYSRFHDQAEARRADFPGLTPYTASDATSETKGGLPWTWGVESEVRETINSINAWGMQLHAWALWNHVLDSYSDKNDQWEIASHFIEPIAFFCMLQPSGLSERLVVASETALHQANLRVFSGEPDRLDQDLLKPGAILRKGDRRRQLDRLGQRWQNYPPFRQALDALNGPDYRQQTRNFRDLSAHSFAPRLHAGHVSRAIRSYGPWEEHVQQPDGSYLMTPHPTKKAVSYAMADAPPLDLKMMQATNLSEYEKARTALTRFTELVLELCARITSIGP